MVARVQNRRIPQSGPVEGHESAVYSGDARWYASAMNAEPLLSEIARAMSEEKLEAVLIGNAAAALQGSPVTTQDMDFCFRATKINIRKLEALAHRLKATTNRPHEPVSDMIRMEREDQGMQIDFLPDNSIGAGLASLRSRATRMVVGGYPLWVADLEDVAAGKRRAGRPKDKAVLHVIEATIKEKKRQNRSE